MVDVGGKEETLAHRTNLARGYITGKEETLRRTQKHSD